MTNYLFHEKRIISSVRPLRHELSPVPVLSGLSSESDHEHEDEDGAESEDCSTSEDTAAATPSDSSQGERDPGRDPVKALIR